MSASNVGTQNVAKRRYNVGDKVIVVTYSLIPRSGVVLRCFWHQDSVTDHHGHQRYEVEVKGGAIVDVPEGELC